jgi:hypothetical protein
MIIFVTKLMMMIQLFNLKMNKKYLIQNLLEYHNYLNNHNKYKSFQQRKREKIKLKNRLKHNKINALIFCKT